MNVKSGHSEPEEEACELLPYENIALILQK